MKKSSRGLIGTLAAAGSVLLATWLVLRPSPAPVATAPDGDSGTPASPSHAADLAPEANPAARVVADDAKLAEPAIPSTDKKKPLPPFVPIHLHGRVLDVRGTGVPAVGVGFRGKDKILANTDTSGAFEIDLDSSERKLVAIGEAWVTLRHDLAQATDREREHILIVAPRIALAGRVADSAGRPLAGASVSVDVPIGAFATFPLPLDATGLEGFSTKSGPDGAFELKSAPVVPKANLVTSFEKLATDRRPLPSESASDLYIELKEPSEKGSFLEGVVVHADGAPAVGARVMLTGSEATADAQGHFRLALEPTEPEAPLVATLKGFQAAVISEYGRVLEATDLHPPPVRLELGPATLTIAGHVFEADGKPAAKWTVSLVEGTAVSQHRIPVITAEKLSLGADVQAFTKADGAFQLGGLRNTAYRLQAWSWEGRMIQSPPIQAGTQDAVLRAEPEDRIERISGRLVAPDGSPIAEVDVVVDLVTEHTAHGSAFSFVKQTKTNADGTFELKDVPRHHTRLDFRSDAIESTGVDLEAADLARPLEVTAFRICRFRFEGETGEQGPTRIGVLDAEGRELGLVTREAGMMTSMHRAPLTDGRSHVLSVTEKASRLVVYAGDEILFSQPLHLTPGEITVVRRAP